MGDAVPRLTPRDHANQDRARQKLRPRNLPASCDDEVVRFRLLQDAPHRSRPGGPLSVWARKRGLQRCVILGNVNCRSSMMSLVGATLLNVLVTGGAGYIGSHACKALAAKGYVPITYDNLSRGNVWAVKWG